MFEKPIGMRDTLPSLYEEKKWIRTTISNEIESWGYQFIETPTLEFYETIGAASAILDQQLFKLLDNQGNTLVLRPDMTAPIARVAASSLYKEGSPMRLAYSANVYRAQQREGGRPAEFEQIGIECVGDKSTSADAEVIAITIAALKKVGLKNFTVPIGHIGYVNALFIEIVGNEERANKLRRFLYNKNYVGYKEHVKDLQLSSIDKQRLLALLQLRGNGEIIANAKELIETDAGRKAIVEIEDLWQKLKLYGVEDHIKIDFNLVSHMSYYTGILFEVYSENVGFLLGNGGRYDQLFAKFGRQAPATGFGLRLDRLIEAMELPVKTQTRHCIVFSPEHFEDALEFARSIRAQGKKVVLQDINGIENVDVIGKEYQEVSYFIGITRR